VGFVDVVMAVTQLHDVIYIVCVGSSTIRRFNATTHKELEVITVNLYLPRDIVACEITSRLYVVDEKKVSRVSPDGAYIESWRPDPGFNPRSLSVKAGRLLVTLRSHSANELIQFDADKEELRRVKLSRDMVPHHAVESPTGTFIVNHWNWQLGQYKVSEVDTDGRVLRQFTISTIEPSESSRYIAVDSRGNIFVADPHNGCVLLLDDRLSLPRLIIDAQQMPYMFRPEQLCYVERSGQLLVVSDTSVTVYDVLRC